MRYPGPSCCSTAGRSPPTGRSAWPAWLPSGEEPPGWRRLFDGVGLLHLDTPIEIVAGAYRDLRIFAGYSGWAAGQLQAEIAEGMWHVVDADYADVFGDEPLDLWRRVLRRQRTSGRPVLDLARGPRPQLSRSSTEPARPDADPARRPG